jgi:hypothetical protein
MNPGAPAEGEHEDPAANDPGLDIEVLQRRRERTLAVLAVTLILIAGGLTAYFVMRAKPVPAGELISAAQQATREALGIGLLYEFSGPSETRIEKASDGSYVVQAEVTAVTPQGQGKKYSMECAVTRRPDGTWGPAKLTLTPR